MTECSAYVGLDVHKDTIAVAVALPGREEPVYRGEIKNQRTPRGNKPMLLASARRLPCACTGLWEASAGWVGGAVGGR